MLTVKPMSLADANRFVAEHHRHHKPVRGHKFSLGCMVEVNRLCTDGTKNACSFLYGAAARAAKVLGYHRIVTYILDTESGISLRASGWRCAGLAGGREWTGSLRPPEPLYPAQMKYRYEKALK